MHQTNALNWMPAKTGTAAKLRPSLCLHLVPDI